MIEIRKEHGHYTILINGEYYCTCKDMEAVNEEVSKYEGENQGDYQATG